MANSEFGIKYYQGVDIGKLIRSNCYLKKKLLQMTKIAREGIAKVTKELRAESMKLNIEIQTKFKQFYDVLQSFMITVSDVSNFFFQEFFSISGSV